MIKIDETYIIGMNGLNFDGQPICQEHYNWRASEVIVPLVKFVSGDDEWVINVTSPLFAWAKPQKVVAFE